MGCLLLQRMHNQAASQEMDGALRGGPAAINAPSLIGCGVHQPGTTPRDGHHIPVGPGRVLPGWGPSVMTPGRVLGQPSSAQRSDVWAVKMVVTTIPCHLTAWLGTWEILATGVCVSLSWQELTRGGRCP